MTDRFEITLEGDQELRRALGDVLRQLEDGTEMFDGIGALLVQNIQFRFDTQTAPDGTPWLPLAASTKRIYEKKYEGNIPGSLLQRTRHMRDTLTHNHGRDFVEVGFGDIIALYHETGTRRGLPRRQLLSDDPIAGTLGEGDRQDVLDFVTGYLSDTLAQG